MTLGLRYEKETGMRCWYNPNNDIKHPNDAFIDWLIKLIEQNKKPTGQVQLEQRVRLLSDKELIKAIRDQFDYYYNAVYTTDDAEQQDKQKTLFAEKVIATVGNYNKLIKE